MNRSLCLFCEAINSAESLSNCQLQHVSDHVQYNPRLETFISLRAGQGAWRINTSCSSYGGSSVFYTSTTSMSILNRKGDLGLVQGHNNGIIEQNGMLLNRIQYDTIHFNRIETNRVEDNTFQYNKKYSSIDSNRI